MLISSGPVVVKGYPLEECISYKQTLQLGKNNLERGPKKKFQLSWGAFGNVSCIFVAHSTLSENESLQPIFPTGYDLRSRDVNTHSTACPWAQSRLGNYRMTRARGFSEE